MKKTALSIIAVLLTITSIAQLPEKAEDISPLLYGESIPEATLNSPEGNEHNLKALMEEKPQSFCFTEAVGALIAIATWQRSGRLNLK